MTFLLIICHAHLINTIDLLLMIKDEHKLIN